MGIRPAGVAAIHSGNGGLVMRYCDDCEKKFHEDDLTATDAPLGTIWRCEQCAEKAWDRQQESN